ncbi:MAG TPA: formyltransferase family protein [Vicinamibacterales bacterium]|nr:formyltransferase family protein [Vicinamibacterales bacterium]
MPSSDTDALRAAAAWLARAQDATGDGGVAGRFRLTSGWSSSYPETTGYLIPTFLTLASVLADAAWRARAERCVDFLLSIQLASGAFPALELADNRSEPSPFNSAQIAHGLHAWFRTTGDRRVLDAIVRAARWIGGVQDPDGAWRQHFYQHIACAYSAHAACWLAEIGGDLEMPELLACAERNLRWVLRLRDPQTGWIDCCGFSSSDHAARRAHTHTIAYTLAGVLRMSERLHVAEGVEAVETAAERLLERLERSRTLPGVLDWNWRRQADYVCLTGNAQVALIWLNLAARTHDVRLVNAAFKAIDEIKRAQVTGAALAGVRGGVPGSFPISGGYIPYAFPNWAAKFFVDALCAKAAWLRDPAPVSRPAVPIAAPAVTIAESSSATAVDPIDCSVVYTTRISPKFAALSARWQSRGFTPSLVVIETGTTSRSRRLAAAMRRRSDDSIRRCRLLGWAYALAPSVNAEKALIAIAGVKPALAIHAGAGILREAALALPRLGTIGAHMGLLPRFRGMNVAEWAALTRSPVGCSVYWMTRGIDTGPILSTREVDVAGCTTIEELRARVDAAQLDELDTVVRLIVEEGRRPQAHQQRAGDGQQFYRMHADLRALLESRLGDSRTEERRDGITRAT